MIEFVCMKDCSDTRKIKVSVPPVTTEALSPLVNRLNRDKNSEHAFSFSTAKMMKYGRHQVRSRLRGTTKPTLSFRSALKDIENVSQCSGLES